MLQSLIIVSIYIALFIFGQRIIQKQITKLAQVKQVSETRTKVVTHYITYLLFIIITCLAVVSLGIKYQQVSLFISSAFAVLGVALVAQWSILSNITAGILIFFVFPYRIGSRIKVVDKDENISGVITEINLFHILIQREDGILITYPNNLMLQKGVLKLPNEATMDEAKKLEKDHVQIQSD